MQGPLVASDDMVGGWLAQGFVWDMAHGLKTGFSAVFRVQHLKEYQNRDDSVSRGQCTRSKPHQAAVGEA